jgi:hypothetical protein
MVDVSGMEVSALVAKGYLPEELRNDPKAIKAAIEGVMSDMAFELEQERTNSGSRLWCSFPCDLANGQPNSAFLDRYCHDQIG